MMHNNKHYNSVVSGELSLAAGKGSLHVPIGHMCPDHIEVYFMDDPSAPVPCVPPQFPDELEYDTCRIGRTCELFISYKIYSGSRKVVWKAFYR